MSLEQPISRKVGMPARRAWRVWLVACCGIALLLSGCNGRRGIQVTAEVEEPHYRRGQQMLRSGQNQLALEAFLKVIEKRGGDAPESHLEAGRIYLNHLKDPIAAIYHFRKYNELRPNSPQSQQVQELIDTAIKEFARRLPGNPLEGQIDRLDLLDKLDKLNAENARLRSEVDRLTRVVASRSGEDEARRPSAAESRGQASPFPLRGDVAESPVVPVEQPSARAAPTRNPVRAAPTPPADSQGRTYTVAKGDNLFQIATRFYGSGSRWPAILDANRDQLRSPADLKPGMVLRIP